MPKRPILALQTQLALPMVPFVVDTLAKAIFDWNKVHWYLLPDPVMFLATYAFFCLGTMFLIRADELPPSDDELEEASEVARRNLLLHSILFISLALLVSVTRAIDAAYPIDKIYDSHAPLILLFSLVLVLASFIRINRAELSYVTGA